MIDSRAGAGAYDLTNCDREPIHIPRSVLPHGALLALDPDDLRIVDAGGDTVGLLGAAPGALIRQPASGVLSAAHIERLRVMLGPGRPLPRPVHAFTKSNAGGSAADAVAHRSTGLLVLEFEPRRLAEPDDSLPLVHSMFGQVECAETIQALCEAVAAEMRGVTGFDRVMAYRFLPDDSGAVLAEARNPDIDSFPGLHYPPSDIPKQARTLYIRYWSRLIPDARYAPAPIEPLLNPATGLPLDLSQCMLRSVSPVHRQDLANMGVVASMSLSLIFRGKLWGLIACHHATPRYLSYRTRDACEIFATMISIRIETLVAAEGLEGRTTTARGECRPGRQPAGPGAPADSA